MSNHYKYRLSMGFFFRFKLLEFGICIAFFAVVKADKKKFC